MSRDAEGSVLYRRKAPGRFASFQTTIDAMDFLARLLMHIPPPKLHTVRYYGECSHVARARRRAPTAPAPEETDRATIVLRATVLPLTAERRRLRRAWAQMIRRVYEVDPLTCRCGAQMRIVAFILDPRVVTEILRPIAWSQRARERAPPTPALAS